MTGSVIAELMKTRRRTAVWILGAVLVLLVVGIGYLLPWLVANNPPPGSSIDPAQAKLAYYPLSFVKNTLGIGNFGGALCMVMGAMTVGSEYGWGTFKTVLTQRPGRLATVAGRFVAVGVVVAIYDLLMFATGATMSVIITTIAGHAVAWPDAVDIAKGVGAGWLDFITWATFGMALAYLFRQSALAIGIGLVYMLLLEGLVLNLLGQVGGNAVLEIRRILPGTAVSALASSFAGAGGSPGFPGSGSAALIGATRSMVTLCVYVIAFCSVSAIFFRRRDITT